MKREVDFATGISFPSLLPLTSGRKVSTMKRSTPLKKLFYSFAPQLQFWLLLVSGLCSFSVHTNGATGASLTVLGTDSFDRNNTFGWRFTPTTDIDVTALGFFDATSLATGTGTGLNQSHDVGIYRVSDQMLVASNTIPAGTVGDLNANFRYVTLTTPVRLAGGTTYLMAGFALSLSPDPAAFASNWTMAPGILYANSPLPTAINPTSGTSQYLVSAHGNPPAVLTYPGVAQTGLLPVFAANFQFTPVVPFLTRIECITNTVVISVTNLTAGVTNSVEKSADLSSWQSLQSFVPGANATNLTVDTIGAPAAFYRIRVGP